MEEVKKRREPMRRQLRRLNEKIQNLMKESEMDHDTIGAAYRTLLDGYGTIVELNNQAFNQLLTEGASDEVVDGELDEAGEFRNMAELLRIKMDKLTESMLVTPVIHPAPSVVGEESRRRFKLPDVQIKKFSGNLTDWIGFWAQFKKIDEDETLHDSDKFQYLVQSLEADKEPHQIVSAYPQSEENYPKAVDALKRRYGDDDLLLQVYVRELLSLVISIVNSKDKVAFKGLYLKLDSHLRALKSLNLEKADPATWLFPLVESSLPEDVLRSWQRAPVEAANNSQKTRLDVLMAFMEKEVQIQQRIELTKSFNGELTKGSSVQKSGGKAQKRPVETVASVNLGKVPPCIFCSTYGHQSESCTRAEEMSLGQKRDILRGKGACFNCFEHHLSTVCDAKNLKCTLCGQKHYRIMCSKFQPRSKFYSKRPYAAAGQPLQKRSRQGPPTYQNSKWESPNFQAIRQDDRNQRPPNKESAAPTRNIDMANQSEAEGVYLQTLLAKIMAGGKEKIVRAFIDSGSQRSYLLKTTANELELIPSSYERVVHTLFGGKQTRATLHSKYQIQICDLGGKLCCEAKVRDQPKICENLPRLLNNDLRILGHLKDKDVVLTDVGKGSPAVELLIGADLYGKILTGNVVKLPDGPVAIETSLGWTLIGEFKEIGINESYAMQSISMAVQDTALPKMWELELLGIKDPIQVSSENERNSEAKAKFLASLARLPDGRYSVTLPWKESVHALPTNYLVARKRLESTTKKLAAHKLYSVYEGLFRDWEAEGIIEKVPPLGPGQRGHFIPHQAVVKPSNLTTPVRPVFDASCKVGNHPSLNDCLHKGENLIQRIPELILRFREKVIGFISDIRKAFLMIDVNEGDREFLRFLWWSDSETQQIMEYRHARVPFGAICSPFILGAVLEFHLTNLPEDEKIIGTLLLNSLYVDNCVGSENSTAEYLDFKRKSVALLESAKMELRLWQSNIDEFMGDESGVVSVLGLKWDRKSDEIFVDTSKVKLPVK